MNSKPILFSTKMVRAILAGRKTQTRRVISLIDFEKSGTAGYDFAFRSKGGAWNEVPQEWLIRKYCPYGHAGDQLWVRETWLLDGKIYLYKANFGKGVLSDSWHGHWKPCIHMPRVASRITLVVSKIRVERVQEITRDDAKAEGVSGVWKNPPEKEEHYQRVLLNPYVANYSVLWDEINAKRGFGWDVNPWVWVVEFKVLEVCDAR